MTPFHRVIIAAAICLLAACGGRQEQASARIVLDSVTELHTGPGPGELPIGPSDIVAMANGQYLVIARGFAGNGVQAMRLLYDSSGHFVDSLGRTGDGPGEYREVSTAALGPGDSLFLLDYRQRLFVLGPDGSLARSGPIGALAVVSAISPDGRMALLPSATAPEGRGQPIHLFDRDGHYIRSFGEPPGPPDRTRMLAMDRRVASDGRGGWWTARTQYRYELEHWDSSGNRTADLTPGSEWFTPQEPPAPTASEADAGRAMFKAAVRRISDLRIDGDGRLWLMGWGPRAGWEAVAQDCATRPNGETFRCYTENFPRIAEPHLEVRSPDDGRLIAAEIPAIPLRFMDKDLAFGTHQDDDGFWHVTIYRMRIEP